MTAAELERWEPLLGSIVRDFHAPGLEFADLMQEARLGCWQAVEKWKPGKGATLAGLVRTFARRRVLDAVTNARRGKHGPLNYAVTTLTDGDGEATDAVDLLADPHADPHHQVEVRQQLDELRTTVWMRLSELERRALIGRLNGEDYVTIAARLKVTTKGIDNALTRAAEKLRAPLPAPPPSRLRAPRRRPAPEAVCDSQSAIRELAEHDRARSRGIDWRTWG